MVETEARERVDGRVPRARRAKTVTPIGDGWTVDTYDVDGEWIVQFPRSDYAAERLRSQMRVLPELAAELSAMVPAPVYTDMEIPAMAYHRLTGLPLDQAPDGLWPERLGRFLYDLHLMPPEYVELRGRNASAVRAELSEELAEHRTSVLPLLEPDEATRFGERFTAFIDRRGSLAVLGVPRPRRHRSRACPGVGDGRSGRRAGLGGTRRRRPGVGLRVAPARPPRRRRARPRRLRRRARSRRSPSAAAFRFFLMPFHEVTYGLQIDDPTFVASGIAGIRSACGRRRGLSVRDLQVCADVRPPRPWSTTPEEEAPMVSAYILIQTEVGKAAHVTDMVREIEGVMVVDPVTGPYDIVARAEAADLDLLAKGTVMPMQDLDGITRTLTCPVLQL